MPSTVKVGAQTGVPAACQLLQILFDDGKILLHQRTLPFQLLHTFTKLLVFNNELSGQFFEKDRIVFHVQITSFGKRKAPF